MATRLALGTRGERERPQEAAPSLRELRQVSWGRILRHDNATFLLVTFGSVLFAFALAVWLTGSAPAGRGRPAREVSPEEARALLQGAAVLLAVLWGLAGLRAGWLRRIFALGVPERATVVDVAHARGYSRVRFEYRHGGTARRLRRTIRRSPRAQALATGEAFTLLVDPGWPKRVVLAELYERG